MSAAEKMADTAPPRSSGLNWLIELATMFAVAVASLSLLLYMGFGDGQRTYEQIYIEKCTSNGILVRDSIEKFLRDGLPLKQYAGFSTLVAPILEAEEVDALAVYSAAGHQLFIGVDKDKPALPEPPQALKHIGKDIQVEKEATHYQIIIPLRTRFETVGSVLVISPKKLVNQRIVKELPSLDLFGVGFVGLVLGRRRLWQAISRTFRQTICADCLRLHVPGDGYLRRNDSRRFVLRWHQWEGQSVRFHHGPASYGYH